MRGDLHIYPQLYSWHRMYYKHPWKNEFWVLFLGWWNRLDCSFCQVIFLCKDQFNIFMEVCLILLAEFTHQGKTIIIPLVKNYLWVQSWYSYCVWRKEKCKFLFITTWKYSYKFVCEQRKIKPIISEWWWYFDKDHVCL